ncbi:hypothetical protein VTP01DRAFT_4583 [Rhizomucor pusillus]|uniref:mitochondrial 37S ribosomal protein mS45 n=1 Tax=Rhizomucor pusillus TaxID=4840 RepID=UPI00374288A6
MFINFFPKVQIWFECDAKLMLQTQMVPEKKYRYLQFFDRACLKWQARHEIRPHLLVLGTTIFKRSVPWSDGPLELFFSTLSLSSIVMQSIRLLRPAQQRTSLYVTRCSSRFISYSVPRFDQEKSSAAAEEPADNAQSSEEAAPPEIPLKAPTRRKAFFRWLEKDGARFKNTAQGTTNYMGSREWQPFPNNPLFQVRPPLSDAKREEIYNTYKSDPEKWTIRQLATRYSLSMRRVEAIIKLKQNEKEMEMNGIPLQRDFAKGMEKLMGADEKDPVPMKEPLVDIFPNVKKPTFKFLEEGTPFTEKDAAAELNRKPYHELEEQAIAFEEKRFKQEQSLSHAAQASSTTKQKKFVIVDTSH